jgi:hypothetical protein
MPTRIPGIKINAKLLCLLYARISLIARDGLSPRCVGLPKVEGQGIRLPELMRLMRSRRADV